MTTVPQPLFRISNLTPLISSNSLSGIPIGSVPPTNGQSLVYNAGTNQFQYATIPPPGIFVDLTSAQTITGVKTIGSSLLFSPGATIGQGANTFTLPSSTGTLALAPTGPNAYVDLTSAQTITGVKTIGSSLGFSAGANITQGANTFTFPSSGGTLAVAPTGAGNAFVDLNSAQTISGVKTIGSSLLFSPGATIGQGANTFTLPSSTGTLALVPTGPNAYVDLTSAQTISGVKTIGSSLLFSAGATLGQGGNTFTLPSSTGTLALAASGAGNAYVDLTSAQTISGVKTIGTSLGFSAGANITQGANTFTLPSASGQLAVVPTGVGNAFVDLTSAQTISGVKTIGSSLLFSAGATLGQGGNTFTLPSSTGTLALAASGAGNAYVDLTSAQTISGVKTIGTSLGFSAGANITQGANTFTLPSASGQLAVVPTGVGNAFVDLTSAQTISGVKTIGSSLLFSAGATLGQGGNTFTLPSSTGTLALAASGAGNAYVDLTSAQTISGVKTIGTSLGFSAGATITQGANTFTLPSTSGQLEIGPTTTNTPEGVNALASVTAGTNNTGIGFQALQMLIGGTGNTAVGANSLASIINGTENVAIGNNSLLSNISSSNVAVGGSTLRNNTFGLSNVAIGNSVLTQNSNGNNNVGVGASALAALTGGSDNVAIGISAGGNYTGIENNNVVISNAGVVGESGAIRIGTSGTQNTCFVSGISGVTVAGAVPAVIGATGQLGTVVSARRFKEDIVDAKDYDIKNLRVVNFRYKDQKEVSVGLIAEEVEQVLPELVVRDSEGEIQTVKYMDLIPILLQQNQQLWTKVDKLEALMKC